MSEDAYQAWLARNPPAASPRASPLSRRPTTLTDQQRITALTIRIIALEQKVETLLAERQKAQEAQDAADEANIVPTAQTALSQSEIDETHDECVPFPLLDIPFDLLQYIVGYLVPFSSAWGAASRSCHRLRDACWGHVCLHFDPTKGAFTIIQTVAKESAHVEALMRLLEHPRLRLDDVPRSSTGDINAATATGHVGLKLAYPDEAAEQFDESARVAARQRALDCALVRSVEYGRLETEKYVLGLGADASHETWYAITGGSNNDQVDAVTLLREHLRKQRTLLRARGVRLPGPSAYLLEYLAQRVILSGRVQMNALLLDWAASNDEVERLGSA